MHPSLAHVPQAYVAGVEIEGVQTVVQRMAACFVAHGSYNAKHRCTHTDRGLRRQDPAPSVTDLDAEFQLAVDAGGESKAPAGCEDKEEEKKFEPKPGQVLDAPAMNAFL